MYLFYVYECFACVYVCVSLCAPDTLSDQKKVLDSLELELQMVLSTMWVLGTELRSSTRAVSALNYLSNLIENFVFNTISLKISEI